MRPATEYRFSIINFGKPDSQYGAGMKPVMYSAIEAARSGIGWQRWGHGMRSVFNSFFYIYIYFFFYNNIQLD